MRPSDCPLIASRLGKHMDRRDTSELDVVASEEGRPPDCADRARRQVTTRMAAAVLALSLAQAQHR
jgi:hypothetical protein